ncbi:MAG: RHS repeat-associated core domain-containing protein [Chloroflexaceae bacterium]|nr:RHS repeat-associated core domain-containing protein [Chloroflexaceae bacterium]
MTETFTYDAVGNQVAHTDFNGRTTTSTYDELDRLRTIVPDPALAEPTVAFSYTLTGQRGAMSDASGTTTYAYDALDRLIAKATPFGTLSYTYDAASNLLTMQSSNTNGSAVRYTYDALNRLATVTDERLTPGTTSYSYDSGGNLETLTAPNGMASAYTYDDLNRLTELALSTSTLLGRYTYTLDDTGARIQMGEATGRTVDYGYDDTYRLLNETVTNDPQGSNGTVSYSYDSTGNRLSRSSTLASVSNQSTSYDANDRPTTDTYDDNGNLLTSGSSTYTYDSANRLVSDGNVSLTYDGDGNLVQQTATMPTTYLVDERNPTGYAQIVEEQINGQVQQTYTYGDDLISVNEVSGSSTTPRFVGSDGLGTVRLLTDQAGSVTDRYTYEAFGGLLHQTGSTANPHRFTGERWSSDLGLSYLRARWYHQGTGRFLTMDTYPLNAQNPSEWNRYPYTANNPVNAVDPSGLTALVGTAAAHKPAMIARPGVLVTGLAAACVYRLTTSLFAVTLENVILGGTIKFSTIPCNFEREPDPCEGLITCDQLRGKDQRYVHRNYADAFREAQSRWKQPIKRGGGQGKPLRKAPCAGCLHHSTRQVSGGGAGPSIGECPCCATDSSGKRYRTKRFAVLLW